MDNENITKIISLLAEQYPQVKCALEFEKPHELLISTRLSAQCTDKRVNMVTPALFEKYQTVADFAAADIDEVAELIKSCGLFRTKARDIVLMCREIQEKYNGKLPETLDELVKLPGVGRKTANLICGELFHQPAYICDTHVIRITNRLGICKGKDAVKIEKQLREKIPPEESQLFCHRLVWHGRLVCIAQSPKCHSCGLAEYCEFIKSSKV